MEIHPEVVKWGAYVFTAVGGWFLRVLWTAQASLRKDLKALEIQLPENYVKKEDYKESTKQMRESVRETIQPLFRKLDRLEEILLKHLTNEPKAK